MTEESNRRGHSRAAVALVGDIYFADGTKITGGLVDVSMSGAFVASDERCAVGTKCQALLFLGNREEGRRLDVRGEVARVHDDGMALKFSDLSDQNYELLRELVVRHASDATRVKQEIEADPQVRNNNPPPKQS